MNLEKIMQELATKRPVFHSEADFQFALAWEIQNAYNESRIRLEFPTKGDVTTKEGRNNRQYIDILVTIGNEVYPIELKYRTKTQKIDWKEEAFDLKDHSSHDGGRYDFIKDIRRLELFRNRRIGYAIFLTNDSQYWDVKHRKRETNDDQFRIHENEVKSGTLSWPQGHQYQDKSLKLNNSYTMKWNMYSNFANKPAGHFKYNLTEV